MDGHAQADCITQSCRASREAAADRRLNCVNRVGHLARKLEQLPSLSATSGHLALGLLSRTARISRSDKRIEKMHNGVVLRRQVVLAKRAMLGRMQSSDNQSVRRMKRYGTGRMVTRRLFPPIVLAAR
jgi:hypothetical protein